MSLKRLSACVCARARASQGIFKENEFLPGDLLLVTDDDLKDIGLPVGPRAKVRNWVKATVVSGGA
jgi:hypothetical protein